MIKQHSLLGLAFMTINTINGNALGSDDNKLSERYFMRQWVAALAKKTEAELIKHKSDQVDPFLLRSFCFSLKKDNSPFCQCSTEKGIYVGTLPRIMVIDGEPQIQYIGMAGGNTISIVSRSAFSFAAKSAPYLIVGYISAGKLYVTMPAEQLNCEVNLIGVPEKITETTTCPYNYLGEFDIKEQWVTDINLQIANQLGMLVQNTKVFSDKRNDGIQVAPQIQQ